VVYDLIGDLDHRPIGGLGIVRLIELSTSRRYARRGDRNVIELDVPRGLSINVSGTILGVGRFIGGGYTPGYVTDKEENAS
jgi:hypothetical protein